VVGEKREIFALPIAANGGEKGRQEGETGNCGLLENWRPEIKILKFIFLEVLKKKKS
jgi:hypothetical protein